MCVCVLAANRLLSLAALCVAPPGYTGKPSLLAGRPVVLLCLAFRFAGECSPIMNFDGVSLMRKAEFAAMCHFTWPCVTEAPKASSMRMAAVSQQQISAGQTNGPL